MNLKFVNDQRGFLDPTIARFDAWQIDLPNRTFFAGAPGVPLGALLELRLNVGRWAGEPIVSGGNLSNVSGGSIFVAVQDHANVTGFSIDLQHIPGGDARLGQPIMVEAIVTREGRVIAKDVYHVATIGGAETYAVPFWNPSTNQRQQTMLFAGADNGGATLQIWGVDNGGRRFGPAVFALPAHCARIITAENIEAGLGFDPQAGNKLRLIVAASAPVSLVSKVRAVDLDLITENAVLRLA